MIQEIVQNQPFMTTSQYVIDVLRQSIDALALFVAVNDRINNVVLKAFCKDSSLADQFAVLPFEESYCQLVCANGRMATLIRDTERDPLTASLKITKKIGRGSFMGAPLTLGDGSVFGTICAIDDNPGTFSEKDLELLQSMARLLSNVVMLEYEKYKDALTGAFNRELLDTFYGSHNFKTSPLGVIYMDLDNFKSINRDYGDSYGDRLLIYCANVIIRIYGEESVNVRMQGNHFVVILQHPVLNQLIKKTQEFQLNISKIMLPGESNLSASIGIALSEEWTTDIHELIHRANTRMLSIKNGSKNGYAY
ncbi:sensor domain-containing diguanylate cyclase [Paenibacillus sp. Z6-24]